MSYEADLDQTLARLRALLLAKHHDYGVQNLLTFGEFGILVRATDKVSRLQNLLDKQAQVDEKVEQTWLDLAGYAVQALVLRAGGLGSDTGSR